MRYMPQMWRLLFTLVTLLPMSKAFADPDAGSFYFIAGFAGLYPEVKNDDPEVTFAPNLPLVGGQSIKVPGVQIQLPNITLMGGSLGYHITDNFAAEVLVGIPPTIDINVQGILAPLGKLAEFRPGQILPLLFNIVYRPFADTSHHVRPYVGFGPALLWIRDVNVYSDVAKALKIGLDFPSYNWGWAAQAGVTIDITDKWFMRLDAKYVRATVNNVKINVGAFNLDKAIDISLDFPQINLPVYSFGIGRKFDF